MKRILLLLCALLTFGVSGTWADVLPSAVVGTAAFQATALTTGASGHTITKDGSGNVTISPNNSGAFGETSSRFNCTLVVKINVPSTTTADVLCEMRQGPKNTTYSQGLFMAADRKLKTSWQGGGRQSDANAFQLDAGEHTIIYTTEEAGAKVYVDGTQRLTDTGLKASGVSYKAIYIPSAYASYITEVHFYSSVRSSDDITSIVTECSNHMHASQQSGTTANVAAGKTLILDKAVAWTSLTGTGTVLQEVNIATTVAGNLPALTLKATAGTLTYTGSNLNGTTLDGVILGGSARINTSNTVNIKNLAGNNISGNNSYAFVGSGTLNFYGTCDLTKKSDGSTDNVNCNIGYGSSAYINIKEDAEVTTGAVFNTSTSNNNANITVETGANLIATGQMRSISATNNGAMSGTIFYGSITLGDGSITTLSNATPFNDNYTAGSGVVTVNGDATLNVTATTSTLNKAITVASGKTLTIDGKNNTVVLTGALTNEGTVIFKNATLTANLSDRNLTNYTFTDCTATLQFSETGDEYKTGGFTITNIPTGVTVKVKKYDATDYETVTPVEGTATISHEVGVSGTAAWFDYTFNETTLATNQPATPIGNIPNRGNAGSGQTLTIDNSQTSAVSYNSDGTFKVRYTPYRGMSWPENYTVAVSGNFPDVENGCLVAFGTKSGNYLALIRGANSNEIKLVKGQGNNTYTNIQTMAAENATAAAHLVVFTKQGNVFKVYCDGVNVATTTYDQTLGGGLQVGSIHGGYGNTGVVSVMDNSLTDDQKNAVFCNAIRVYDYVISDAQMAALKTEFPYVSEGGNYTRTISADANLDAVDAWYNVGEETNTNLPTNNVVDAVTYYPDIVITTTAASTLTVDANMDSRNIEFDGAGKLTIASDGTHSISIKGSVTANGPISVKYGAIDMSAVPVSIGESGSIEFDFSDYVFSVVTTSTDYPVTGLTSNYGAKVTSVYPSDIYHTYTLAHNGTTNRYYLTVGPSVALKQQQAIALVTPYYNGSKVGTAIGKYTISLGETSYANLEDFEAAVTEWKELGDCVEPTITLNTPAAGYYRFKNVETGKYLTAISGPYGYTSTTRGVYANGDANSAATVIRLYDKNSDGKLYMYNQGYGFGWTDANNVDGSGAVGYLTTNPDKYVNWFPGTTSGQIGFAICYGNGTGGYASYLETGIYTADTEDDAVIAGTDYTADAAQWIVETATTATIPMNAGGDGSYYATMCLPYDVTISNADAYTLALDGDWAVPTQVPRNQVPAGTAVLLKGTNEAATATINTDASFGSAIANILTGTYLATTINGATDYVLGKDETEGVGFYHWTSNNLGANRAYLPAATVNASLVKGFSIRWDEEVDGVNAAKVANTDANVVYDLQGRRVSKPARGLYIVNGKKVAVK